MLDGKGILRHKNRQLGVTLAKLKEELTAANKKLQELESERDLFDATSSVIDRSWRLLDEELHSLAKRLGLNPHFSSSSLSLTNGNTISIPQSSKLIQTLTEASDKFILADVTKINGEESEDEDDEEVEKLQ